MAPSRKYIGDSSESAIDSDNVSVGHLPVLGSESTNSSSGFFFFFLCFPQFSLCLPLVTTDLGFL